jgi:hypothetical protein
MGQDEENIFSIRQNRINRYLTGISTRFQASETGSIKMEIQGNTFLACNRSLNLMGKGVYNILENTVDPRSSFSENYLIQEHFYAALTSASDLDKIGYIEPSASTAMNMVQPKYIGVNVMGSGSQLNVAGNSFFGAGLSTPRYIENGIFVDALNCQFKFQQNNFNKLRTAIQFYSGMHTIDKMECNTFDNGEGALVNTYSPRIGLLFGGRTETDPLNPSLPALQEDLGTAGLTGPIGNSGINNAPNPSGNAWPVDPDDLVQFPVSDGISVLQHWKSPLIWVSLQNNNPGFNLEYWAYNNEFVWPITNNTLTTFVSRRPTGGEKIMMYRQGSTPPPSIPGEVVYIEQCSSDLTNVFPLRMAIVPLANAVTSYVNLSIGKVFNAFLGDAIPNPASSKVTIPVFIPELASQSFVLSIFDLSGKNVFQEISITEKGDALVEISLHHLPDGVYGYNLREGGKVLGTRKLVVIK